MNESPCQVDASHQCDDGDGVVGGEMGVHGKVRPVVPACPGKGLHATEPPIERGRDNGKQRIRLNCLSKRAKCSPSQSTECDFGAK